LVSEQVDEEIEMNIDEEKVDEAVLALLYLTMHGEKWGMRAWKAHDWEALNRLHEKGFISDPQSKAKSVVMTEEGEKRAEELFRKLFSKLESSEESEESEAAPNKG
jgi:hypothetical protein